MKRFLILIGVALFSISAFAGEREAKVRIFTNMGKIDVKLYNETPLHRDNFLKLVQENQYDSILFHRVIKLFMIQAGEKYAPDDSINRANYTPLDYTIPAEIVYPQFFHKRGQLCAARTGNEVNPERASSAMQFYIVTGKHYTDNELDKMEMDRNIKLTPEQREAYKTHGGAPHLDGSYTVFGEVVRGMKTVRKIELSATNHRDAPQKEIRIKKTKLLRNK
jgi:peptidylprolyl isomerase/peptidyl-prolyl cis-trans isomerase B (cyclophilin B)